MEKKHYFSFKLSSPMFSVTIRRLREMFCLQNVPAYGLIFCKATRRDQDICSYEESPSSAAEQLPCSSVRRPASKGAAGQAYETRLLFFLQLKEICCTTAQELSVERGKATVFPGFSHHSHFFPESILSQNPEYNKEPTKNQFYISQKKNILKMKKNPMPSVDSHLF